MKISYLIVGEALKRLVSETPNLIHDNTVAPHITGGGILLVVESLKKKEKKKKKKKKNKLTNKTLCESALAVHKNVH